MMVADKGKLIKVSIKAMAIRTRVGVAGRKLAPKSSFMIEAGTPAKTEAKPMPNILTNLK